MQYNPISTSKSVGETVHVYQVSFSPQVGVVLLENPVGSGLISKSQLVDEVSTVFGLDPNKKRAVFSDGQFREEISDNLAALVGKIVYVRHETSRVTLSAGDGASLCRFVDVEHNGKKATVLLENPAGSSVAKYASQVNYPLFFVCVWGGKGIFGDLIFLKL